MMSGVLVQYGALVVPLGVVVFILGYELGGLGFVLFSILAVVLFGLGGYALRMAVKEARGEAYWQQLQDARVVKLFSALLEKDGIDAKTLIDEADKEVGERNKQATIRRVLKECQQ